MPTAESPSSGITSRSTPPYASLTFEDYGAGIGSAATVLRANATSSGLHATVPTCPGWTVSDLVAHQGMVHRWAADTLRGQRRDSAEHLAEGIASADILQWFDDGATALLDVLSKTPEDWDGFFFLAGDGRPRDGWARRQCHETTIHAVDAMSARLGRAATADETWFSPALAADGIDELITGFVPRGRARLRSPQPLTLELATTDTADSWTVHISEEPTVVARGSAADAAGFADARWTGPARDLYLLLWNRVDDDESEHRIQMEQLSEDGADVGALWRETMKVRWS